MRRSHRPFFPMKSTCAHERGLAVGIGCRRGASADAIEAAVRAALNESSLSFEDISLAASIDAKENEAGLLAFCARHELPLRFFTAEDIARVPSSYSRHADKHMNVDGVCEPCALLASGSGRLVVGKTIVGGVTVAIAMNQALSSTKTS